MYYAVTTLLSFAAGMLICKMVTSNNEVVEQPTQTIMVSVRKSNYIEQQFERPLMIGDRFVVELEDVDYSVVVDTFNL